MLSKKMQDALNEQINAEMYSGYLYLAMSAHLDAMGLKGCAHWMRIQYDEEMVHAFKLFGYVQERDGEVELKAIDKPDISFDAPLAAFQAALEHERKVTKLINNLMDLALDERDHASSGFLQWFVDEQVEEEASAGEIVQHLEMVADSKNGLFMIDRELGRRPAAGTGEADSEE